MTAGVDEPLEVRVAVRPGPMASGLLGRALGAVAARSELPLDRLDDALLAVDALCDFAARATPGEPLRVQVAGMDGELWLHVGPLAPEVAAELLSEAAIPGGPPLLETLADQARLSTDHGWAGELVALTFAART